MSLNEEFDDLARRKLEERQVAFQEADWLAARKLIDAERGGHNRGAWIIGAVALSLISGLVWVGTSSTGTAEAVVQIEQVAPRSVEATTAEQPVQYTSTPTTEAPPKASGPATASESKEPSIQSIRSISDPVHQVDRTTEEPTSTSIPTEKSKPQKSIGPKTGKSNRPKPISPKMNAVDTEQAIASKEETMEVISPEEATDIALAVQTASVTLSEPIKASEPEGTIVPEEGSMAQTTANSNTTSPTAADQPEEPIVQTDNNSATDEPMALGILSPSDEVAIEVAPQAIVTTEDPAQPMVQAAPSSSDTTVTGTASTTLPTDSATAAALAIPPPLVPAHAPWEISLMGGVFSSTTKYSGSNSTEWNAGITKENSVGIGAELMHMGRNFGIGTGLQYTTYAERLKTDALDRSTTTLHNFWYLMPVDTMVLVITDSIPGTPPTYWGTSTSTTVNVLTQGTDTTTTTERIREARNELNRVSYLEVPLLLDAHLVQGRWSFGLRGGPTVGLLTGRRGTVPAPGNEGYVGFIDQPFRELIFGYTARAYVRYRFNAAWSVGIEPTMRGQLMNSLGSGELSRKATAKGVMLSLSYRLR